MSDTTFLPEDYLAQKAERRTNIISLTLFGVVMIAVVGAFFVTNRQARTLKKLQDSVNDQYQQAGQQIQELTELEQQKEEMLNKAELAAALVERVPRSILLAELINRMPERLALLEFYLESEKIKTAKAPKERDKKGRLIAPGSKRGKTKQQADEGNEPIEAPRYQSTIEMVGVAPTDLEVSKYMTELNTYPLVQQVILDYSEEKEVDNRTMRKFKIVMRLDPDADVRGINPLTVPRIKNPMAEELKFNPLKLFDVRKYQPQDPIGD